MRSNSASKTKRGAFMTPTCRVAGRWARLGPRSSGHGAHPHALQCRGAGDSRYGTALGVIRAAVEQGKKFAVLADETRPFLQGSRLTAGELVKDGIDTTVITDNMAGSMMRLGHVELVVVGADRIARERETSPTRSAPMASLGLRRSTHSVLRPRRRYRRVDLNTPDARTSRSRAR